MAPKILPSSGWTRRSFLERAGVFAAMRLVPLAGVATLSGCGGGGSATNGSSPSSGAVALALVAASSTNPTALTPLVLQVQGLDATQPFTVQAAFPGGSVLALSVIGPVSPDRLVVGLPLFLDPATALPVASSFSLQVLQNGQSSPAMAFTLQEPPSVASYGVPAGAIGHNFLNFLALELASGINLLQAVAALPTSTTDSTVLRAAMQTRLADVLEMRSNVDNLAAGTQTTFIAGYLPDGTAVEFNATSLEIFERIVALHLQSMGFLPNTAYASPTPQPLVAAAASKGPDRPLLASLADLIDTLSSSSGLSAAIGSGLAAAKAPNSSYLDDVVSGAGAVAAVVGLVAESPAIVTLAAVAGVVTGAVSVVTDIDALATHSHDASWTRLIADSAATVGAAFGGKAIETSVPVVGDLITKVTGVLANAGTTGAGGVALQGAGFFGNALLLVQNALDSQGAWSQDTQQALTEQALGTVNGSANVSSSSSGMFQPLVGVRLTDPATGQSFTTLADVNGTYTCTLPLGVSGMDYAGFDLSLFDPVTGNLVSAGSILADVSSLTAGQSLMLPLINGSCYDTDGSSPDFDDPDCD